MLGAGTEHQIAIKLAKDLGYRVIAADGSADAPGLALADVGVVADIKNIDEMVEVGKKYEVDGVMTHAVEIPHIVSRIAKALGLPGIDPVVADRTTFKSQRIDCLKKAGIRVPEFAVTHSVEEGKQAAQKIGYPVVVKPVDNAGARGVQCVKNDQELETAYAESQTYSHDQPEILIEQYLDGFEISTEALVYDGKIVTTGFGDRNYTRSAEFYPYFIEDGHNVPSTLPQETQDKVIEEANKAIRALGIDWGVAKGDILVHDGEVYILEMASRTSGGWFCSGTVPRATGVHILKSLIKMSVGDPVDEADLTPTKHKAVCQRYVIPTEEGAFVRFDGVEEAAKMPGVDMFIMFKTPAVGEMIHKATNHAERFGQIITVADTMPEAIAQCEAATNTIKIVLEPQK